METSTATSRVATAVREAMLVGGVSQQALSHATGIPRVTLSRRLHGHSPFTVAELALIADHLGVAASDFLEAA